MSDGVSDMETLTGFDDPVARAKELLDAATPGPWEGWAPIGEGTPFGVLGDNARRWVASRVYASWDMRLIAEAPQLLAALVELVEKRVGDE